MAELLRCKSCGYVIEAGRVGEVCPACGVPRRMMEAWKDPVSERRRMFLWLDLHPFVLSLIVLVLPALYPRTVSDILRGFLGVLPLAVIGSFFTGIFDARVRFRKSSTPMLNSKKLYGLALFLLSAGAGAIAFTAGPYAAWARPVDAVLLAAGVVCAVRLGRIGQGLLQAIFPG